MGVSVVSGDIAKVKVDALITAINSGGMWFGGIDGVINRVAGNIFHSQAAAAMPLCDGQTIVALKQGRTHGGSFINVVFVVDDLQRPLHEVVYNGLKAASDAGFKSASLPAVRMGVMLGVVEKSAEEAVEEMAKGIKKFLTENPDTSLQDIIFVIHNDKAIQSLLEAAIIKKLAEEITDKTEEMTDEAEGLSIDPREVEKAFLDCLYKEEEMKGVDGVPEGTVIVEGIQNKIGFHPGRLEEKRAKVTEWLKALPHQFRRNGGGGWSFLNACNQENGVQWTGFHQRMDQLFCLGMGLKLVECQMPREMWKILPGGMPYYVINIE